MSAQTLQLYRKKLFHILVEVATRIFLLFMSHKNFTGFLRIFVKMQRILYSSVVEVQPENLLTLCPYTDADSHKASKVINGYLRQKEFVVIDINKLRSEFFSFRWDTSLNLKKKIESLGNTSN